MLNATPGRDLTQQATVVLFTWPSDGMALPFVSYKSDRTEAKGSGYAFGRGMLKLRDFLMKLKKDGPLCGQDIHLLCHSMGNYLLQSALQRLADFSPGTVMPRIFEQIFLCAPDVDDDILESGKPMARLPEIARGITIYHNRRDKAMYVSDYTKGNPERLGTNGAAHPTLLHNKVHQVDCTPVVTAGFIEHSYYLDGAINGDIRLGIDGAAPDDPRRRRKLVTNLANVWQMTP
jgi:esterase/lipase superfamily enzyme